MRNMLAAFLVSSACGSAPAETVDAGSICDIFGNEGRPYCVSTNQMAVCLSRVSRLYGCSGPMGCNTSGGQVFCDMSRHNAGDTCPPYAENSALCKADISDGGVRLHCVNGVFQTTACPKECAQTSTQVFCR